MVPQNTAQPPPLEELGDTLNTIQITHTEQPVDEALKNALENPQHRLEVLKINHQLENLLRDNDKSIVEFPPCPAFQRLIIHKIAEHFCMDHNVVTTMEGQQVVLVSKNPMSKMPSISLESINPIVQEAAVQKPVKIMTRQKQKANNHGGSGGANHHHTQSKPPSTTPRTLRGNNADNKNSTNNSTDTQFAQPKSSAIPNSDPTNAARITPPKAHPKRSTKPPSPTTNDTNAQTTTQTQAHTSDGPLPPAALLQEPSPLVIRKQAKSFEEREAEYVRARERIFGGAAEETPTITQQSAETDTVAGNVITPVDAVGINTRRSRDSSPAVVHRSPTADESFQQQQQQQPPQPLPPLAMAPASHDADYDRNAHVVYNRYPRIHPNAAVPVQGVTTLPHLLHHANSTGSVPQQSAGLVSQLPYQLGGAGAGGGQYAMGGNGVGGAAHHRRASDSQFQGAHIGAHHPMLSPQLYQHNMPPMSRGGSTGTFSPADNVSPLFPPHQRPPGPLNSGGGGGGIRGSASPGPPSPALSAPANLTPNAFSPPQQIWSPNPAPAPLRYSTPPMPGNNNPNSNPIGNVHQSPLFGKAASGAPPSLSLPQHPQSSQGFGGVGGGYMANRQQQQHQQYNHMQAGARPGQWASQPQPGPRGCVVEVYKLPPNLPNYEVDILLEPLKLAGARLNFISPHVFAVFNAPADVEAVLSSPLASTGKFSLRRWLG